MNQMNINILILQMRISSHENSLLYGCFSNRKTSWESLNRSCTKQKEQDMNNITYNEAISISGNLSLMISFQREQKQCFLGREF